MNLSLRERARNHTQSERFRTMSTHSSKPIVAIAGGTSPGLGKSIVNGVLARGKYTPIVFSRQSSKTPAWLEKLDVEVKRVDYKDEDGLTEALEGVDTLLCTLLIPDPSWAPTQITLLNAALRAGVRRFAPAEWGIGQKATSEVFVTSGQPQVWEACRAAKQKAGDEFEWAAFRNGLFMNYIGIGAPDEERAIAGMNKDGIFVFDLAENKAYIPLTADGEVPDLSLTDIRDIGKFVAAALELPAGMWQEDMSIVGDRKRIDEIVEIIEKVREKKVEVIKRMPEQIEREKSAAKDDLIKNMWLELEQMTAKNEVGYALLDPVVNRLCPDVKPTSIEEYVKEVWG